MRCRVSFLLKTYLWTVLVFIVAKVGFMFFCREGHELTMADGWQVISHGLTLDLSTSLYFLIVPFVLTMTDVWWHCHRASYILRAYFLMVAMAMAVAFVADTSLYPFWGYKLDATCLQYVETPTEAMASVTAGYLVVRALAIVVVTAVIFGGYEGARVRRYGGTRILGGTKVRGCEGTRIVISHPQPHQRLSPAPPHLRLTERWLETALYVLLMPVIVIGIRGGVNESTTNVGQVYYSQNQFLNHSAVNPVFSFLSSFEKTASQVPDYPFMSETERARLTEGLYSTESIRPDTLLRSQRPDIVIILLESCGGIFTEDIGHRKDVMPRLNQLTHEGVYFANCYANSYRTDRGTLCTWSGYPSFPRSSVMKMPAKTRFLPGIAKSLRAVGYETHYLYGGDINFTNMRSYLVATGFEKLHWMKDYTAEEQRTAEWGVRDDITFQTLLGLVCDADTTAAPRLIGYSTLSSHEPWDVPTHRLDDEVLNAFNYLDECLGRFIDQVRQTPQWRNLLVVLLPDHGITYGGVGEDHEEHDHVPMLWLGGAVREPRRVEQLCNQTDLPATLLGQLGLPHDDYPFSRDVMSRNYNYPFAVHTYNNGITMRDSTGFAVFDLNANRMIVDKSSDARQLMQRGKAIVQTAAQHLKNLGTQ